MAPPRNSSGLTCWGAPPAGAATVTAAAALPRAAIRGAVGLGICILTAISSSRKGTPQQALLLRVLGRTFTSGSLRWMHHAAELADELEMQNPIATVKKTQQMDKH